MLIQERALRECKDIPALAAECAQRMIYIPDKMPPREVPGTYFEEPQSATWRLAHRTVTVPHRIFALIPESI